MVLSNIMLITIGTTILRAVLVDSTSTEALKELLNKNPLTIEMNDYNNFEKVGQIGTTLPRNDERITTEPGDIILYLGNSLCLYYATNTYTFTRIGKIQDVTQADLKRILGEGSVTVTFSLEKSDDEETIEKQPESSKEPSKNKGSKTAIIAGTVSAAAVVIIVVSVTLTCYFKKVACFGTSNRSESQG